MLIGEVGARSGVSTRMLRHYDALGLVRPTGRTVGGYREYSDDDIRRIFHVESLRSLGLTLRQVGDALAAPNFAPSALVDDLVRRTEDRIAREQELLTRLRTVDALSPTDWEGVLRIVELMQGLSSPSSGIRQRTALEAEAPAEVLAEAILTENNANVVGALQWALDRAPGDALRVMARGLGSDDVDVRRRAILTIAELPGDEALAVLDAALTDDDPTVNAHAALALGRRGVHAAVPTLVTMVVEGRSDVEASDILGVLSQDPDCKAEMLAAFDEARHREPSVRIRVAQALVEIPGPDARRQLDRLAHDDDATVALVARALLR
ncbi:MerR family transcriptional regulator [Rhodococcoides trifolii]|uniref:MerR family transcriptional regulator n=1 Tax=Rhodococcoides trifolii TaxID=908250 RepID=A0A917CIN6_9NOCA|nr:HEAT repeat domain-containing protein [Rhodococcus trifolii]GGF90176.1 MerR family transcriptional regulator [Rhodococcus trifolii]